jgi:hypothetical protein
MPVDVYTGDGEVLTSIGAGAVPERIQVELAGELLVRGERRFRLVVSRSSGLRSVRVRRRLCWAGR